MELNTPSTVANAASSSKSVPSISASSIRSEDAASEYNPEEAGSSVANGSSKKRNYKVAPGTYHRTTMLTPSVDDPDINALFKTTVSEVDGQRIFTCLQCRNDFLSPYNARRHSNVHLRDTRTECKICGETVSGPLSLAAHMETHGGREKAKKRPSKSKKRKSTSSVVPIKDTAAESLAAPDPDTSKRGQPEKSSSKKSQKRVKEDGAEAEKKEKAAVAALGKKRQKKNPVADVAHMAETVTDRASASIRDEIPLNVASQSVTAPDCQPVPRASKSERSSSKKPNKNANDDKTEMKKATEVAAGKKKDPGKNDQKKRTKEESATEVEKKVENTAPVPSKKSLKKKPSGDAAEAAESVSDPASDLAPGEDAAKGDDEAVAAPHSTPGVEARPSRSERSSNKKSRKKTDEDGAEITKKAEDADAASSKPERNDGDEAEAPTDVESTPTVPSKKAPKKKSIFGAAVECTEDTVAALVPEEIPINDTSERAIAADFQPPVVTRASRPDRSSSRKTHKKKSSDDVTEVAESVVDPAPALIPDEIPSSDACESAIAPDLQPVVTRSSRSERSSSVKSHWERSEDVAKVEKKVEDSAPVPSKKVHKKKWRDGAAEIPRMENAASIVAPAETRDEDASEAASSSKRDGSASRRLSKRRNADEAEETEEGVAFSDIPIERAFGCARAIDLQTVRKVTRSARSLSKKSRKNTDDATKVEGAVAADDVVPPKDTERTEGFEGPASTTVSDESSSKKSHKGRNEDGAEAGKAVQHTVVVSRSHKKKSEDIIEVVEKVEESATGSVNPEQIPFERETSLEFQPVFPTSPEASNPTRSLSKKPSKRTIEDVEEVAMEGESCVAPAEIPVVNEEIVVPLEQIPTEDAPERGIALDPFPAVASPGDSDGSLSEGVSEVVRGVRESVSLEEVTCTSDEDESTIAMLGSRLGSVSSMSDMSVIENVAARVRKVEGTVATGAIPAKSSSGASLIIVPLEHIPIQDAPEVVVAPDPEPVEAMELESDGGKESEDEQTSSYVLEVMQRVVDAVCFIAVDDEHPSMEEIACDESVITIEPEPAPAAATPVADSAKKKKKKKKRNPMVGYAMVEVVEEPDKDGIEVTAYASRSREEEERASGSRPSASQERRSTRIQMRMAMEASAEEEARRCTRTRKVTPPPIYPSNIEKVREAREMEREMKESKEITRRALAQLPPASKRPRVTPHVHGKDAASKRASTKRSSRAGSSSRASSSRESLIVTCRDAAEAAVAAAGLHPRHNGSTAAAAAAASVCNTYYDPRWSRRGHSSTSLHSSAPSSSRRATPQPPLVAFHSLSPVGPVVGTRRPSLCNSSLYPPLGTLCGPRIHRHQPMLSAPARLHFPAQLTAAFLSTIFHPAWMKPAEMGEDEQAAILRRGHAHFVLPMRMYNTETLIERCLQALEETSIPLPALQPLLPAPCPLLADGCSDPLSDVLKFVPRVPAGRAYFSSHRVQPIAEARYTTASEGARNHVFFKSGDREWWEVRTFPSFDGLTFAGHRPAQPTSARRPEHGMWYTVADKNKNDIHSLRLATKCTYVTSKQKPVFSVHESLPRAAPPPATYSTPSVYSTPAASPYLAAPPSVVSTTASYGAEQNQTSRPSASVRWQSPVAAGPSSSSFSVMTMTNPRPSSSSLSDRQPKKRAADFQTGTDVVSMVKRMKSSLHESYPGRQTERQPQSLQRQHHQQQTLPPLQLQPMYRPEHDFYEYDGQPGFSSCYQIPPAKPEVITVEEDGTTFTVL